MRALALQAALYLALAFAGSAYAQAEEELGERYAPVVRLVEQEEECGPGEPYEPIDIDAILDEDTVSLRGPWRSNDLVEIAPSADDLGRGLYEYNLDFPGDALSPGCDYERWARRASPRTPSRRRTPTWRRSRRTPSASRSSTGSTTPSTTGTTCTRATGR